MGPGDQPLGGLLATCRCGSLFGVLSERDSPNKVLSANISDDTVRANASRGGHAGHRDLFSGPVDRRYGLNITVGYVDQLNISVLTDGSTVGPA